ncbi:MAG TPA: type II CAAX endopeptidase family protein [Paracoccaceae bacterium]|nr:type II CAAX endopeptidase family protein [Paracoccaceae bacterium]
MPPHTPLARRRPVATFVALAYAWSWSAWGLAAALPGSAAGTLAYYAGGFGPALAAAATLALAGRPLRPWLSGLLVWRCGPRAWAAALLLPPAVVAAVTAGFAALGGPVEPALLPDRLAAWAPSFVVLALIGGGNEEPGWRGLAQPELQRRLHPAAATALLGLVWALWHAPLLLASSELRAALTPATLALAAGITLLSITLHAFWYAWLWNRTRSLLLCVLLHGGWNAANGTIPVRPEALTGETYLALLSLMTAALAVTVAALLLATRGRLGAS